MKNVFGNISIPVIILSFNISAVLGATEGKPLNDTKPSLKSMDPTKIDQEKMRLAKVIHKKILEKQAKEKVEFKAYTDTMKSGVKIEMLPIKTRPFVWKGKDKGDELQVSLDDFWMAKTESSWAAHDSFYKMEFPRQRDGSVEEFAKQMVKSDLDLLARPTPQLYGVTWGAPKEGHSAVGVTHHAANKYCQWLSFQTGHFYRLPTEAEWEFACRGGSEKKFSWGDEPTLAKNYAWFGIEENTYYKKPGLKKPNGYGLLDMHGNVLEMTLDGYVKNRKNHFGKDKVHNPWVKATKPYPHVTKGGHWKSPLEEIIASARIPSQPKWKITDPQAPKSIWAFSDAPFIGFRIVRPKTLPSPEEMYYYWNSGTEYDGEMAVNH